MSHSSSDPSKGVSGQLKQKQKEFQGLLVKNSHEVNVVQTELQGLLLIQAALQAALQVAILSVKDDEKVKKLQEISQSLDAEQIQSQGIIIEDCDGITVTQTELQVDVAVQAAIQLLAKLSLLSVEE